MHGKLISFPLKYGIRSSIPYSLCAASLEDVTTFLLSKMHCHSGAECVEIFITNILSECMAVCLSSSILCVGILWRSYCVISEGIC